MPRAARRFSLQGFLIAEAVLAIVVIATGLVFVSRALASQLQALRTMEERETLLALAQGKLLELELIQLKGLPHELDGPEIFREPYEGYKWSIKAEYREDLSDKDKDLLFAEVHLNVSPVERSAPVVEITAIWPEDWAKEWY